MTDKMTAEQALDNLTKASEFISFARDEIEALYKVRFEFVNVLNGLRKGRPADVLLDWLGSQGHDVSILDGAALTAPRVPEEIDRFRNASEKGFSTSESCGPDGKYKSVTKFRNLSDLQEYERARIALLAASPAPAEPYCKDCQSAGMSHCSDPVGCGNTPPAALGQWTEGSLAAEVRARGLAVEAAHEWREAGESAINMDRMLNQLKAEANEIERVAKSIADDDPVTAGLLGRVAVRLRGGSDDQA